ncbi:MAG: glycine-rich domain-containing protein [Pseudonocardiaceae bacterium]
MNSVVTDQVSGRAFVSEALFGRLVDRIVVKELVERPMAERIMDQALAYLKACADNPGAALSPSPSVDIGWHTFLLYTQEYAEFCQGVGGFFIHHVPDDEVAPRGPRGRALTQSVDAIRAAGIVVDTDLWPTADVADASCSNSGCGAGPPPSDVAVRELCRL